MHDSSQHNQIIAKKFGLQAKHYNAHAAMQEQVAETLCSFLPNISKPALLEIGCGTGHLTQHLLRRYPFGDFLLTDLSKEMLTQCRQRFAYCGQNRFCVVNGEQPDLEEKFDLIISSMTVHWFCDPHAGLSRLRALLKPGSALFYAALGPQSFPEWRLACTAHNLDLGLHGALDLPGIFKEEQRFQKVENMLSFFKEMKATGAAYPKNGYQPANAGALRRALKHADAQQFGGVTWHILYGKLTAED